MNIISKNPEQNDTIVFADESKPDQRFKKKHNEKFKLLIVDDEKQVHTMTKLVLSDYFYMGRTLEFYSAYSAKEAEQLVRDHPDAACILLDVVMETNDAGLEVAKFIREKEKNDKLRIILRTGQPGKAPEKEIIVNYDINDYKEKTELTSQKLFTTVTTALRSYMHLVELENQSKQIREKNIRLNEEIARRIVAESNLTKYNRSLEKMLDTKKQRLEKAIQALKASEKELQQTYRLAAVGDISSAGLPKIDSESRNIRKNLDTIDRFYTDMNNMLEKYEIFSNIIASHSDTKAQGKEDETAGDIDQLKKNINIEETMEKYSAIIQDSKAGLNRIKKTIKDIAKFIPEHDEIPEETDINAMLENILKKFRAETESKIDVQTEFGNIPEIKVKAKSMEKAFRELVKNAFEAIDSHGIISVSSSYGKKYIKITISDIGYGIAPEHLEEIFRPYFTANKKNARGLGLCLARSIIKSHSGTIDITSTLDEGTNVIVKLKA